MNQNIKTTPTYNTCLDAWNEVRALALSMPKELSRYLGAVKKHHRDQAKKKGPLHLAFSYLSSPFSKEQSEYIPEFNDLFFRHISLETIETNQILFDDMYNDPNLSPQDVLTLIEKRREEILEAFKELERLSPKGCNFSFRTPTPN